MRTANKIVTDKRIIVTEMIVELDVKLLELPGSGEILTALQEVGAKTIPQKLPAAFTVTWKRQVSKAYDRQLKAFVPTQREYVADEPFVLRLMNADTFVLLIENQGLETEVQQLLRLYPNKQLLLLVDGMSDYYRKHRLDIKRMFNKQVRDGTDTAPALPNNMKQPIDQDEVDTAILELNTMYRVHVIILNKKETVAEWLVTYTREIASRPYEKYKQLGTSVQVAAEDLGKSGKNQTDTWSKMLQVLFGVTEPTAEAILQEFPTVRSLMDEYKAHPEQAARLLTGITVNRAGYTTSGSKRGIGDALSLRIYDNFTKRDPECFFR